jgi:hypothetical protein
MTYLLVYCRPSSPPPRPMSPGTRRETNDRVRTGHFYFAKNRTFLLRVDNFCFSCCTIRFHMVIVEETQEGREGALSQG